MKIIFFTSVLNCPAARQSRITDGRVAVLWWSAYIVRKGYISTKTPSKRKRRRKGYILTLRINKITNSY